MEESSAAAVGHGPAPAAHDDRYAAAVSEPGAGFSGAAVTARRLHEVRRLLRAGGGPALDRLAALAARLLDAPSSQVSLLGDTQTIGAGVGLEPGAVGSTGPLADSLCTVTAAAGKPLIVTDAAVDQRVLGLPPVRSGAVGAYLGAPLRAPDGLVVGALCVFGSTPRSWSDAEVATIADLADAVSTTLELAAVSTERQVDELHRKLATDAAGVGAFDLDVTGGAGGWDEQVARMLGFGIGDAHPDLAAFSRYAHPDDRHRVRRVFANAVADGGEFEIEYRVSPPGGETRWLLVRARPMRDRHGRVVRLPGAALDITTSREADHHLARVLDTVPTPFFFLDRQWRFQHLNIEAERIIGLPREKLIRGVLWDLLPHLRGTTVERHYRNAFDSGRPVKFEVRSSHPSDRWYEAHLWPEDDGLSVHLLDISDRRAAAAEAQAARRRAEAAQRTAEQTAQRLRLLATVSTELSATLDTEKAVARLAQLVVPDLGQWCIVSLADDPANPAGTLRDIGWWHADPQLRPLVERYGPLRLPSLAAHAPARRAIRSGKTVVIREDATGVIGAALRSEPARALLGQLAPRCAVFHPLHAGGRTLGLLSVFSHDPDEHVSATAVEAGSELAARAGLAMDSARLYSQQQRLIAGLQRSMLTEPPQPPHLEIAVRYQPAAHAARVGGDWYDAFVQPDGATVCVVGDITGHDIDAAAAMGQVRALLRGIGYHSGAHPAAILAGLDATMKGLGVPTTATAIVTRIEPHRLEVPGGPVRLYWSNAGHPPPVLLAPDRSVTTLTGTGRHLLLGVAPHLARSDEEILLHPGATVFLYTDGLIERRGTHFDDSLTRLSRTVAELADQPLDHLCDNVLARLLPDRPDDDVALLAVRLRP